jgi:hypothetical protein
MTTSRTQLPRRRGNGWLTAAAVLVAVVLLLPVLLLPLTTSVPLWAWLPLLLLGLAALFWLILRRRRPWVRPAAVGLLVLAAVGAVVVSQTLAVAPPVTGPDGEPVPGSIATMEKVDLGGSEQWITIRGPATRPIRSCSTSGWAAPAGAASSTRATLFQPLEKHFTVVSWDEPGTGQARTAPVPVRPARRGTGSWDDATALANHLRQRFGQERIVRLRGVVVEHHRHLAGAGTPRALPRPGHQRTDGQHHRERPAWDTSSRSSTSALKGETAASGEVCAATGRRRTTGTTWYFPYVAYPGRPQRDHGRRPGCHARRAAHPVLRPRVRATSTRSTTRAV